MNYLNWIKEYTETVDNLNRVIDKLQRRKLIIDSQIAKETIDLEIKRYMQIRKEILKTINELRGKYEHSKT